MIDKTYLNGIYKKEEEIMLRLEFDFIWAVENQFGK